jgi:xanthine dehydrogenase YagS FAD-binding subunit
LQVSEKSAFDWALVSCAASATIDGDVAKNPRIALGVIAPVPHLSDKANAFLDGKPIDESTAAEAAKLLLADAAPRPDNAYKLPLAAALVKRTLLKLIA